MSRSACARLEADGSRCTQLAQQLATVTAGKEQLAEELSTTCRNYESQLAALSDHLAEINMERSHHL